MRIALMQPYLIPYAGYFRLFDVDLFIFHDDAQFTKQSYINRNRLTTIPGGVDWLTIPLKKMPTETSIKEVEYADQAQTIWEKQIRRFKVFGERSHFLSMISDSLLYMKPVEGILHGVDVPKKLLGMTCEVKRSGDFAEKLPVNLKGQDRVLAICEWFKATEYVNAPGGKNLYDKEAFAKRGIELKILQPYEGNMLSILERLTFEKQDDVRKEIDKNVRFI